MATNKRHDRHLPAGALQDEGRSRTLIYFPIIHTEADMGALKESVVRATLERLGRAGMSRKVAAIAKVWHEIERVLDSLPLIWPRVRLYQDGLPVCDRETEIIEDLARTGSRNHQLLLRLMRQGASLMGTESADLLVQEYRSAEQVYKTRPPRAAGLAAQHRAMSQALLQRRDQFIARRINETLKPGETGILFMGMLHGVDRYLSKDIKVVYPLGRPR